MITRTVDADQRFSRTLNAWLKGEDKSLQAAILDGKTVFEAALALQREPVSVLRHLDTLEQLQFDDGTEEWVEVMSLALSGVPLREVIDWCMAAEERMPYELIDAMRSGPDLRAEFELARELKVAVPCADAMDDLVWLAAQPAAKQAGYAASAAAVQARFDALTPTTLRQQVIGHVALERSVVWACAGGSTATGRGNKASRRAPPSTTSGTKPRKASGRRRSTTKTKTTTSKPKGILNKWAYANWQKSKAAKAASW